jgi:hypothetical protein
MLLCSVGLTSVTFAAGCRPRSDTSPANDGASDAAAVFSRRAVPGGLSRDKLMDPLSCKLCHPVHYAEWQRSMHAYASDDPVFIAMNRRGQRLTNGRLGKFCVNCHAPMAVRTGATSDGLNLAQLPARVKGVTCYFCHSVDRLAEQHKANNPLQVADDGVMRGAFADALSTPAHGSTYSPFHDRDRLESARMCGSCHDIVNDHGVAIERTFAEWQESVYAQPQVGTSCGQCHMAQSKIAQRVAQVPRARLRRLHDHSFPGVDHVTGPGAGTPAAKQQVEANQAFLNKTLQSALCVAGMPGAGGASLRVVLDNVAAGHSFPSGSAQDRRMWIEVIAYVGKRPIYESGVLKDPLTPVTDLVRTDVDLWLLRDRIFDARGRETHDFAEAACYESELLPAQLTFSRTDVRFYQSHVQRRYPLRGSVKRYPDRVTLRVRLSPIGQDVIQDLIHTGDLPDDSRRDHTHIYDVGEQLEWTAETATERFVDSVGLPVSCISKTALRASTSNTVLEKRSTCKTRESDASRSPADP